MTVSHTGGCLCGAVRFKVEADPLVVRACWCRDCQYFGGGGHTVNGLFPSEAVSVEGRLTDYPMTPDSGHPAHRWFCPTCGTSLFSDSEARPRFRVIRIGAMDRPQDFPPAMTIWTRSAPHWASFDPGLPAIDRQPQPPPTP